MFTVAKLFVIVIFEIHIWGPKMQKVASVDLEKKKQFKKGIK